MSSNKPIAREQLSMITVDSLIAADNPVRVIDLFVEMLPLQQMGFKKTKAHLEGRPPYQAKDLLKLFLYAYLNRIRSSRKIAAECLRNVELWWLIYQLTPGYHTIADFRKDNPKPLKEVFKKFSAFLKGEDVFDGKVEAIDGTKVRAQNNKKNTFNESKLASSLAYIEEKVDEYLKELEECDAQEDKQEAELKKKDVSKKIDELNERKKAYEQLQDKLSKSEDKQISLADEDSRSLPLKDGITDVCYNIQVVADSKHNLVAEFATINTIDQGQLCPMASKAMEALSVEEITVLADKGYHTGKDLEQCKEKHITTIVAYPERHNKNIDEAYQTDKFIYNNQQDCYTCPQGATLTTNGKEYEKSRKGRAGYMVKRYETKQCVSCPFKKLCTKSSNRVIERSQYQDVIDENNKRVDTNKPLYKTRQQIVEPIFGTMKRNWGYTYTLMKSTEKVDAEMAIIFTVYNLRRAMSIFGVSGLIERLKQWKVDEKEQKSGIIKPLYPIRPYRYLSAA